MYPKYNYLGLDIKGSRIFTGAELVNKYSLIDLAGNERKPSLEKGLSTLQTSYINSSLLALKECFRKYNIKRR